MQGSPTTDSATPLDSATVVVLREAAAGIEIFCVERHARSGAFAGAVVFPGGKVDPQDSDEAFHELTSPLAPRVRALSPTADAARALAVAGLRELLEEAAILPATGGTVDATLVLELREALLQHASEAGESRAFAALLRAHALRLATDRLEAIWRWITPAGEPRRFDTRFYLLALPEGQLGRHDDRETTHSFWASPQQILARWERSEIVLLPPTLCTVQLFRDAASIEHAFRIASSQPLAPICPVLRLEGDRAIIALPGDPLHPEPGLAERDPSLPTRFVLSSAPFTGRTTGSAQRPSR